MEKGLYAAKNKKHQRQQKPL